ncbi:MAG: hypothetical protein FOGNACKC_00743 [Anaerolineae bacterium]|nr:hypothetical protein [Anaerolineae bacterium]
MLFNGTIDLQNPPRQRYQMLPDTGYTHRELKWGVDLPRNDGSVVIQPSKHGVVISRARPHITPIYVQINRKERVLRYSSNKFQLDRPKELPGGHFMVVAPDGKILTSEEYDRLILPDVVVGESLDEAAARLERGILAGVKACVDFHRGKVWGVGLSGGIDSVLMTHALHRLGVPFKAYTTYIEADNDDYIGARQIAQKLGLDWTPLKIDLNTMYPHVVRAVYAAECSDYTNAGMSVGRLYIGNQAKADGVQVVMQGDGADGNWGISLDWGNAKRFMAQGYTVHEAWQMARAIHIESMAGYLSAETKSYGANGLEWISPYLTRPVVETILSFDNDNSHFSPSKQPARILAERYFADVRSVFMKRGFVTGNGMNARKKDGLFTDEFYRRALAAAKKMVAEARKNAGQV